LKQWNKDVFGNLKSRRDTLVHQINALDAMADNGMLSMEDQNRHRELSLDFWQVLRLNESLLCQKARSKWISEGDQNTSFFHSTINWKRRP
ncbi:hypothetical protein, partial [Pseudomonas syringae]|uniref:hypothetical protein n=1 Tax=Pseudomonas syringae TaxID=317 RepID=UPI0034D4E246